MWSKSEYQHAKSRTQHFHSATTEHNFSYLLNQLTIGLPEPPQNSTLYQKGDTGNRDKKATITQEGGP